MHVQERRYQTMKMCKTWSKIKVYFYIEEKLRLELEVEPAAILLAAPKATDNLCRKPNFPIGKPSAFT
jgi:hypothetical protein